MKLRLTRIACGLAALVLAAGAAWAAPGALTQRGMAEYDNGDLSSAIADLRQATRQNPRDLLALYYLANAYWQLNQNDRARPLFQRLAALDPTGQMGSEARKWLSANGNAGTMSAFHLPTVAYQPPAASSALGDVYVSKDGKLHVQPPVGFDETSDTPSNSGTRTVVEFMRDMPDGEATYIIQATYRRKAPSSDLRLSSVADVYDQADELLPDYAGTAGFDLGDSHEVTGGQEQGIRTHHRPAMTGQVRGFWAGDDFVVAVAIASRADWGAIQDAVERSMDTIKIQPVAARASASVAASRATGSASASPSATLAPDAPWWLRVQSQLASASPGLHAPPWGTPGP